MAVHCCCRVSQSYLQNPIHNMFFKMLFFFIVLYPSRVHLYQINIETLNKKYLFFAMCDLKRNVVWKLEIFHVIIQLGALFTKTQLCLSVIELSVKPFDYHDSDLQ